jgi:diacylglycerol kinase family enzyme
MTLVLLNRRAHGGRASERWRRVADRVDGEVAEGDCGTAVAEAIARGVRSFIAAGGDGTVNAVLNSIVASKSEAPLEEFTLGAVGLGSSNDFHKPYRRVEGGIPLHVDQEEAQLRDIGVLRTGSTMRYFLIGASFGTAAYGNYLFDRGAGVLGWLKPRWTGGAIAWAALSAIAGHRNVHAEGVPPFASLSVMKSRHLSGSLSFDSAAGMDDGQFAVHICDATSRRKLLRVLWNLQRGRFSGTPGCRSWVSSKVELGTEAPIPCEVDGEIVEGQRFEIAILPERIRVCS